MHEDLYKRFIERERDRNQQLVNLIAIQQKKITELRNRLNSSDLTPIAKTDRNIKELSFDRLSNSASKNYVEVDINQLIARKNENEKLETE